METAIYLYIAFGVFAVGAGIWGFVSSKKNTPAH